MSLAELGNGLFYADGSVRFFGFDLATRMAVARVGDGGLLLYSPVYLTNELRDELGRLGEVAYLIAPNKIHNLTLPDWCQAYPQAELWVAPGLPERRPDLAARGVLREEPEPAWSAELDQCLTAGNVFFSEALMLHRPSRTLLVADFVENIDEHTASAAFRTLFKPFGLRMRPAPSPEFRLYTLDPDAASAALARPRSWHFDRIVMCHGAIVQSDAERVFASVCDELIDVAKGRSRLVRWGLAKAAARQ